MKKIPRPDAREAREATDAALFGAIAEGDLAPLGLLFDRHHDAVRQFLLRVVPEAADVDDLVQETFMTAARAGSSFDGRESARPFLIGVAVQLMRRRRRTLGRVRSLLDALGAIPAPAWKTPEDATSGAEQGALLRHAISRLSEERRLVLVMVEYSGMSGVEVGRALDVPSGTVWRRLHEARCELRRALEERTR